jgi:anti-sigma regulatory factor (Ser/Thr protein kinase)
VVARGAAAYVRKRISIRAVIDDILAAAGVLEVAELVLAETRRFGRDHRAPREARRFVSDLLERWECREALDTVHLLLSEVVANAVVHAGSAPEVSVRLLADAVRVEVGDDDPTVPEPAAPAAMGTSGRGLRILDSLARRWGANLRPGGGKVVWFDVPRFDSPPAVSLGATAHPAPRPSRCRFLGAVLVSRCTFVPWRARFHAEKSFWCRETASPAPDWPPAVAAPALSVES